MNRSDSFRRRALPVTAIVLGLVALALVAGGAFGRNGTGTPVPTDPPTPTPTANPSPTPQPTPLPTPPPNTGSNRVDLDTATDNDVTVVIDDETDSVTGAVSGRAGDGMTVRWYDSEVVNTSDKKIRLTWVGLPLDDEVELTITKSGDGYKLAISQLGPPAQSDATGFDRVLVIEFDEPVQADDIEVVITNSNAS
jgi:hypothetical protein